MRKDKTMLAVGPQKVSSIILSPSPVTPSPALVILNPSPIVFLSEAKDLALRLRGNSAKDTPA